MRDFRDAKAMAQTLRTALAGQQVKITIARSLELVAKQFGVPDWNTLSAAIRQQASARKADVAPTPANDRAEPPPLATAPGTSVQFSTQFEATLHRALDLANARKHDYATLEHLLLALIDDADAATVLVGCAVDLGELRESLTNYIDNGLKGLMVDSHHKAMPTAAFQRVVQRATGSARDAGLATLTGANLFGALFAERLAPAVRALHEQDMTVDDAIKFNLHGVTKPRRGSAAPH